MQFHTPYTIEKNTFPLPLQSEVKAVLHFLNLRKGTIRSGLDIGFTNAGASQTFRQMGGYWMTVEMKASQCARVAPVLGEETVLTAGQNGELPFEDKQFDVVVVACAAWPQNADDAASLVRECHRVIKAGGYILFTASRCPQQGLGATLDDRLNTPVSGCYSESGLFQLMRDGFDVLGFRCSCRFFVQQVKRWTDRRCAAEGRERIGTGTHILYALALFLDKFLFFTKGYQMTVFGHRKGWRERRGHVMADYTVVSDALLCDPSRSGKSVSMIRFK